MSDPNTCSQCGYVFPSGDDEPALAGLCPRCLAGGVGKSEVTELAPQTDNAKVPIETFRPPLKPGMTFKGFEVLEVLGQGGMGVVYKARQQSLNRLVALKLLNSQLATSEEFAARFAREAKVLASLNHPNVVQVFDFGKEDGLLYLVMEHVDGPTLEDVMKKKDVGRFLTAVRDVAKGLQRVHEAGLVHRDVKPSNILIAKDGTAKISDFGLAIETEGSQKLTQSGMFVGTPHYVSPEHAQGKKIDGRSDLYSLGVILFEGYAGRPPFQAPSATALLLKHVNEAPPALYKLAPQSPRAVQEIVRKLLAKNPAARHDTAASLVRDLDRAMEEGKAPKPAPGTARKTPAPSAPPASNPMMKWIAGGIAAAALIGILVMVFSGKSEPPKKEEKPVAAVTRPAPKPLPPEEKPVEPDPVPAPVPAPTIPEPKPQEPKPQEPKPPGAIEEALRQGDKLYEQARAAFEEGKSRNSVEALTDAGFKAEEAKEKYAAVQVVGTDELKAKAMEQIKLVAQLQKMANESRLAILNAKGGKPSPSSAPPPGGAPEGKPAPVAPSPAPANPAPAAVAVRAPVPEASTLKEAEKTIREVYKTEFAKKAPADQLALAQKMLRQAAETTDDPKARYVLLREARDLALLAGDLETAVAAVEDMALGFDLDLLSAKNAALTKLSSSVRSAEAASALAEAFELLARQALDADNFDIAVAASTRADGLSKSSADPSFASRLQELRREIALTKDEYLKVKSSIDKPGTGDQEALGRYYAFVKGDWDRGLEIFASAAKPPLNALAEKDLARPADATARVEVADGWWDLAEKEKSPFRKLRLQERTRLWYEASVGSLTGLSKARAEKRLEALDGLIRGPVDLLKYIDLTRDGVSGNWTRTSDGLVAGGGDFFARVQIPYVPPAEYDLTVTVERKEGQQDFYMGLVQGDTQFGAMVNAGNSTYCEIQGANGPLARYDSGVTMRRPITILYQVRKNSVEVRVDGRRILNYRGDLSKGSMFPQWNVPDRKILFVGSHGTVHVVTRMQLVTVTGKGRALRPASGSLGLPPVVSSGRGPVDVLALLDPRTDAVTGEWTSRGKSLVTPPGTYARIQAPYELPEEYDLRLQVEKQRGSTLIVGLGGRSPVMLTLDGCGGNVSGLEAVDGKRVDQNETRWNGALFRDGKKSTVLVSVRKSGITATVDDQKVVDWKGERSRLSMPNDWQTSNVRALWIGSWEGVYQIDQAVVTPVGGSGVLLRKPAAPAPPDAVPPLPKGTLDLLALVDPVNDAVSGNWSLEDKTLVAKSGDHVRLMLPVIPPDEYDLRVVLERREGNDGIVFGLARGANQWTVFVDKLPTEGGHTGLEMVDNSQLTLQRGMQITTGQPATFDFRVRKNGITAMKDGKPLFSWQGNTTRLGNYKNWVVPNPKALFLGQWWNTVRYTEIKLTPVSGEGRLLRGGAPPVEPAAAPVPKGGIDLLALVDPQKDAYVGEWKLAGQRLTAPRHSGSMHLIRIPQVPPAEYDLRIVAHAPENADSIDIGLPTSSGRFTVILDGWSKSFSCLYYLDGKVGVAGDASHRGRIFTDQKPRTIVCSVRAGGVTVTVDDKIIIRWTGDLSRLSCAEEGFYRPVSDPRSFFLGTWSPYIFSRMELLPAPGSGGASSKKPGPVRADDPDATPPGFVSLMPLIDVQKDTVTGTWRMVDGKLTCDNAERAKLEIPYRPPAEYDFRIVFTRIEGSSDVNQILSKGGKPFAWCMGGMSNTNSGFGMINGKWAPEPPNPSLVKFGVEQGRTYVSIVEVRKDGLKATVNGSLVSQWKTNYGDMDLQDAWRLRDSSALGLGTFHSPTTFHKIEIREVTGRGKTTR